jgi:hypothetical protein
MMILPTLMQTKKQVICGIIKFYFVFLLNKDASIIDDLFGPIVTATPPVQQQPIPTSLSMQNINNFHSLTNNDTQKQMK